MEISDVKIRRLYLDGRLRAIVSVTFGDCFVVHDIKIISIAERTFVAMPSRRDETGTFRDIVHPINVQARQTLEEAILNAYDNALRLFHTEPEQR